MKFPSLLIIAVLLYGNCQSPGVILSAAKTQSDTQCLLNEDFRGLKPGMFSAGAIGAHAEYHYLSATAPKGNWVISCFRSVESQRAWRVIREDGNAMMQQAFDERQKNSHPMIVTGSEFWRDYSVTVRFSPDSDERQSGFIFRYKNDRCYYFLGIKTGQAVLKLVHHAKAYHKPYEKILAQKKFSFQPGAFITGHVDLQGDQIQASLNGVALQAKDSTFKQGKVALTSDVPARYSQVVGGVFCLVAQRDRRWAV